MRKLKLLLISLCLSLVGCAAQKSTTIVDKEQETPEILVKEEFPAKDIINYYEDQLKENIVVPIYKTVRGDFDVFVDYDRRQFRVYITATDEAEFEAYAAALVADSWSKNINDETDATFKYKDTRAKIDFYNMLDYEEEPYLVMVCSLDAIVYNDLQIMKDIVIDMWGFIDDGVILAPDEAGIIRSARDIIWEQPVSSDDEPLIEDERLKKALHDLLALSIEGNFPGYLFYDKSTMLIYDAEQNIAEVYLGTYDFKYILYMYSHYEDDLLMITFMAGPDTAFPNLLNKIEN